MWVVHLIQKEIEESWRKTGDGTSFSGVQDTGTMSSGARAPKSDSLPQVGTLDAVWGVWVRGAGVPGAEWLLACG